MKRPPDLYLAVRKQMLVSLCLIIYSKTGL